MIAEKTTAAPPLFTYAPEVGKLGIRGDIIGGDPRMWAWIPLADLRKHRRLDSEGNLTDEPMWEIHEVDFMKLAPGGMIALDTNVSTAAAMRNVAAQMDGALRNGAPRRRR